MENGAGSEREGLGVPGRAAAGATLVLCLLSIAARPQPAPWWSPFWDYRQQITVTTGANSPLGGYAGYTVRISGFNTAALVGAGKMRADLNDLRVVRWTGDSWVELPRHVLNPNAAATDIRFMLQQDIAASSADTSYYLYYGNPAAGAPPAVTTTSVYRWWDDASADREASYVQGRVDDSAHGSNWGNTVSHNAAGYYAFNTDDNFADSLRPMGLTERDVYAEFELYHEQGYPNDITSGPIVRLSATGSGATELSAGHYYYEMADSSFTAGVGYVSHGDITFTNRGADIDGVDDTLAEFPDATWTRVAIAAWGTGPTDLKGWFEPNPALLGLGGFGVAATTTKTHGGGGEVTASGQAGIWLQQQRGRVRNLLIRRYVEPEPALTRAAEEEDPTGLGPPPRRDHPNGDNWPINDRCGCGAAAGAGRGLWPAGLLALAAIALGRRRRLGAPSAR